ncbi:18.1 kDa class I heat shock protein-like [Cyclospora cayetanensis]|uniref:18.1 kDa class I heat shock protein-like n=1 Tax=Cyclospora cayetanensis TaxID=88456 RepID=A0A6P6RVL8_9EIME|nr:18.1 kDa class I heat shock protein-like [Cyclospora cayetanensis]
MSSERVVVTGSVSPTGTTRTTRTTTYNLRAVPGPPCVLVGSDMQPQHERKACTQAEGEFGNIEELKKYIEDTRNKLLEDPRTRQMIERGEATWDEVKAYLSEHGPRQREVPSGPTSSKSTYTYSTGFWYPMAQGGAFTAAPNTVFEVACRDPEATKISLRPQADVVFDAKTNQLVFAFDLPGFTKRDVDVEIDGRCISISGERPKPDLKEEFGENMECFVAERNFGFFCRRFQLPPNAIEDSVSATMENGVLFVRVSTSDHKSKTEKKKINIE